VRRKKKQRDEKGITLLAVCIDWLKAGPGQVWSTFGGPEPGPTTSWPWPWT